MSNTKNFIFGLKIIAGFSVVLFLFRLYWNYQDAQKTTAQIDNAQGTALSQIQWSDDNQ